MNILNNGEATVIPLSSGHQLKLPQKQLINVPDNLFNSDLPARALLQAKNVTLTTDAGAAWPGFPATPVIPDVGDGGSVSGRVNTYTKAQRGQIVPLVVAANIYTPDMNAGNFFSFTPVANFTLANPTNKPDLGTTQSGSFFITQDATGNRVMTLGSDYKWVGGIAGTLSTAANAKDRIDYVIGVSGSIHLSVGKDIK